MALTIAIEPHPLLEVGAFVTRFDRELATVTIPPQLDALAAAGDVGAPLAASDTVRAHVRALLRDGGFKPAGRSKPASEYLHAAAADGRFPRINAAVDACNVVSLHSGLPISLVDLDRTIGALAIRVAPVGTSFPFNPSGQVLDASGLVCLYDGDGPTGTPVKDAQRTKTHDGTRAVVAIVWGTRALPGRCAKATAWYRELVQAIAGAQLEDVVLAS